jgi:hypothetical protein
VPFFSSVVFLRIGTHACRLAAGNDTIP